jgi:hypothetical protein
MAEWQMAALKPGSQARGQGLLGAVAGRLTRTPTPEVFAGPRCGGACTDFAWPALTAGKGTR